MTQDLNKTELLPCPFCGIQDLEYLQPYLGVSGSIQYITCQCCGVMTTQGGCGSTEEVAIYNWNNRPAEKGLAIIIEEMKEREAKLRLLLPEIEQLLIQHYHTDLEDKAHEVLLKITEWKEE